MLYDVFISYSRKDTPQVNSLIDYLRREIPGIKLWYDIEGIETAEEFGDKIIGAINESNAVIFACSDNSLSSKYCKKEVMYAKNIGKKVIPYLLPRMTLKDWLLFEFGNINCIHATHIDEINRMVNDLKRWSEQSNSGGTQRGDQNQGSSNSIEYQLIFDPVIGEFKQNSNGGQGTRASSGIRLLNGHEFVDLTLPSGLKWATNNVGASKPEDLGEYFAWGEIRPKSIYTRENSQSCGKDIQWLRSNGYIDAKGDLTSTHDAARQIWGSTWRMPTSSEIKELLDNTTYENASINGVKGYLLRSKNNGNCIFLPAAGFRSDKSLLELGEFGVYWSSTPHEKFPEESYYFDFDSGFCDLLADDRHLGRSIRPVSD